MARTTIEQLYSLTIPEVRKVFLEVMQGIVDSAMINEMMKAIEAGDEEALIKASGFNVAALSKILDAIEQAYSDAADITVDGWPTRIRTPSGMVMFTFNMRNPRVEEDLKNNSSEFISRITEEVRQNVKNELQQGMIRGDNPRTTALNIVGRVNPVTKQREGGVIGLDTRQAQWAQSARQYLTTLDKQYFQMGLRDKRFDKTVLKAIESGKPLPADVVEKLVTAYKNRALKYRADMIARTETIHSIARSEYMAHLQGIEEGILKRSAITKEWDDVGDSRERTTHRVLGFKYGKGKGVGFDEPFLSPSGARLLYPGDRSLNAPAEETVHCRCRAKYKVDWIANSE